MFVESIEAMFWTGDEHDSQITKAASWDDVVEAVRKMNGDTFDGVMLNGIDSSYMGIVGGKDGQYVVAGVDRQDKRFILTVGESKHQWIAINVGRQENEYAGNEVVPLETVLVVAHTFFDVGECDLRFNWNERAAKMSQA